MRAAAIRTFASTAVITVVGLAVVGFAMGLSALSVAIILVLVEIAFSFDNAIVNAKVLGRLSEFWQRMFLTVGAVIAIFGMRIVFPIFIVALTAGLSWSEVVHLALHQPDMYAQKLEAAHLPIAAFGGGFLLVLALDFFVDPEQQVLWLTSFERSLKKLAQHWAPPLITTAVLALASFVPANHHHRQTFVAGMIGVAVYSALHGLTEVLGRVQRGTKGRALAGWAGFWLFVYLEILDSSFSFDSVIGAFAISSQVVLIAIGLGIGALWVRSLTVFLVRTGTLAKYRYIEHGAHYTILALAFILLLSIFYNVPEVITGLAGLGIIGSSLLASHQALRDEAK
ncbi:MAG TPA: DUF475 domain-containing protein [Candidatus Saccharimonadales bacterium]|nr:DUF475 domain-containing protein [Candidatus Saccharimonadales bacterium]